MILTSPDEAAVQTPPEGRGPAIGLKWDRMETLYSFARARAFEGLHKAEQSGDVVARREHRQSILTMDAMFTRLRRETP